ncbi:MAG: NAD-dependent epimerase/dehydratase family protein [Dehalococcoidia bacterium]
MRILVTGGAGFVGSTLCESLLDQGHWVTAVDNLITGKLRNIDGLRRRAGFKFVERDVCQMETFDVDAVFHLASPASPVGYGLYPIETMITNSEGTRRALEVARQSGARFLLASTSEVYGDPLQHPQTESYFGNVDPIGPRSCYDEGKRYAEALTTWYGREYGVDQRIVRIFNCYGPRNDPDDGRMVPSFVMQALRGEPITVYGDGSQTRSLCFVSDLVRGLEAALSTGVSGRVYNLGNPDEHSILEFAQIIQRLSGSSAAIAHEDERPGEIARRKPDITRATDELGWSPEVGLEEGLARTIDWYRSLSERGAARAPAYLRAR